MKEWIIYIKDGINQINRNAGWPLLKEYEIEGILWANANKLYNLKLK